MGYRKNELLICAYQKIPISNSVECNLEFCGLIVMENPLRPESAPVIEMLNEADIRTLMVTGEVSITVC